jgi:hypothetical protein
LRRWIFGPSNRYAPDRYIFVLTEGDDKSSEFTEIMDIRIQRVFTAIRSLEAQYVYWPNPEECARISRCMGILHGLPGVVGIVDGTPVNLEQRPGIDGAAYFSRKSRYCINLQLVCDDTKRIRYYLTG